MEPDDVRRLNCSSPSRLNSSAQRTDFFHGLLEVIRRAIDTLKGGDLYKLYEKCSAWRDAGGDLLQEMAERVDGRIAAARRELDVLEAEVL